MDICRPKVEKIGNCEDEGAEIQETGLGWGVLGLLGAGVGACILGYLVEQCFFPASFSSRNFCRPSLKKVFSVCNPVSIKGKNKGVRFTATLPKSS